MTSRKPPASLYCDASYTVVVLRSVPLIQYFKLEYYLRQCKTDLWHIPIGDSTQLSKVTTNHTPQPRLNMLSKSVQFLCNWGHIPPFGIRKWMFLCVFSCVWVFGFQIWWISLTGLQPSTPRVFWFHLPSRCNIACAHYIPIVFSPGHGSPMGRALVFKWINSLFSVRDSKVFSGNVAPPTLTQTISMEKKQL